ncbi:NAD-dependent epimerase/dehydratase family protein [Litorihabitans aurantiacus]|uniref:NAD-dependent epimerase/dehydratase family protein n=1 Tax=Litorihabitans aurantiacus TaxID=1930061 RepID=UPI0024E04D53|nr:NAD(P)-dependent oxidoreductase [Litorihabitans aurantiacus]
MTRSSLVVGSRGLLGRSLVAELRGRGDDVATVSVPWSDEEAAGEELARALERLVATASDDVAVWWCAGAGVTATPQHVLDAELRTLERFVDDVRRIVGGASARRRTLFYSSSAGGVFAGSQEPPFTELTTPAPLAPYGHAKLRAEAMVSSLADAGIGVAIGRLANIYGPGQDLAKPQGLISQLCLAHHTARPINVYVSLDTLRDYIFVDDAARLCADLGDAASPRSGTSAMPPVAADEASKGDADAGGAVVGAAVVKIIASGRAASIGALIADMRRLFKRRVPVVLAASPYARQQARDLRLRSVVLPEIDQQPLVTLINGIDRVNEDIGAQFRAGVLDR